MDLNTPYTAPMSASAIGDSRRWCGLLDLFLLPGSLVLKPSVVGPGLWGLMAVGWRVLLLSAMTAALGLKKPSLAQMETDGDLLAL